MVPFNVFLPRVTSLSMINSNGVLFTQNVSKLTNHFWRHYDLRSYGTSTQGKPNEPNLASVKHITIQTCGPLYQNWREIRKCYADAPKQGLTFNVEYVDTKDFTNNDEAPVVLALHGAPGSHKDYESMINHLTLKGVRMIVPNFPEYDVIHSTKYFRHSTHERKSYILDFLKAIKVDKLDMLITHSSGIYPGLDIYANEGFPMKSIVLISPGGHRRTRAIKPSWFADNIARIGLNPVGRKIFNKFGKYILKFGRSPMRLDNLDGVLFSAVIMFFAEFERLEGNLLIVEKKRPKLLLIFGDKDRVIEKECFYEMASILGANQSHYSKYDANGNCLMKGKQDDWINVIEFTDGGHFPFKQFPTIINQSIEEQLNKISR